MRIIVRGDILLIDGKMSVVLMSKSDGIVGYDLINHNPNTDIELNDGDNVIVEGNLQKGSIDVTNIFKLVLV